MSLHTGQIVRILSVGDFGEISSDTPHWVHHVGQIIAIEETLRSSPCHLRYKVALVPRQRNMVGWFHYHFSARELAAEETAADWFYEEGVL